MLVRVGVRLNLWRGLTTGKLYFSTANSPAVSQTKPETSVGTSDSSQEDDTKSSLGPFPPYSPPRIYRFAYGNKSCLQKFIGDPEKHKEIIFWRNEHVVVVYVKRPMAKVHLIAITNRCQINQLPEVSRKHLPYIKEITAVAESIISSLSEDESLRKNGFQYGFHPLSPMLQLPLHIVSRDFVSGYIRHRKNWQSFNSKFFIPARTVISMLEVEPKLVLEEDRKYMKYLKRPMFCHRCNKQLGSIPRVREHVRECDVEPMDLSQISDGLV